MARDPEFVIIVRDQMPVLVVVLLALAAYVGTIDNLVATGLWALLVMGGVVALSVAFPTTWRYGLWLLGIYSLSFVGALFFLGRAWLHGNSGIAMGSLLEVASLYIAYHLVFHIKSVRDLSDRGYTPLGLWALGVWLILALSNVAALGFVRFEQEAGFPGLYLAAEVTLVLLVVYVLGLPERAFFTSGEQEVARFDPWQPLSTMTTRTGSTGNSEGLGESSRRSSASREDGQFPQAGLSSSEEWVSCPRCEGAAPLRALRCPRCGRLEEVATCRACERIVAPCPSCRAPTTLGRGTCPSCNAAGSLTLFCASCGLDEPLRRWTGTATRG